MLTPSKFSVMETVWFTSHRPTSAAFCSTCMACAAVNPADDLDQQDLPDVMAQRLTELDRRISRLEKDAQGDVPPSIHEVIQKQQR